MSDYVNEIHMALVGAYLEGALHDGSALSEEELIKQYRERALELDIYIDGYNKGIAVAEIEMREKYSFQAQKLKERNEELEKKLKGLVSY